MSNATEQIKERLDIADFIKQYVELKSAGSNFKGLCPFHQEKTPSFMVSQAKQMFKCFGCGKGGDIFTFLEEYEGIEFKESLKILADKAGVALPRFNSQTNSQKNRLYDILKFAADFYHLTLIKSKSAQSAREYIKNRQIDDLTRDNFKLGYSSNEWRSLFTFLKKKKFSEPEILKSGLVKRSASFAYYDMFRDRLMFPIFDEYSRAIGFGGRILIETSDQPKYINTPQTELYDKSRVVYGLDKAKDSIRRQNLAVLVEGYMDVIASHKADIKNVVAASGTALTEDQLKLVKRFTNNIALSFDMDDAGINAALRSYKIAADLGMNTKVVQLPQDKDPDDIINQNKDLWQKAIDNSRHILDYYFAVILRNFNINKVEDKKQAKDKLLPWIVSIKDAVERSHFLEKLSVLLKVSTDELIQEGKRIKQSAAGRVDQKTEPIHVIKSNLKSAVEHFLALILVFAKKLPGQLKLPQLKLRDQILNDLYKEVGDYYNKGEITKEIIARWKESYQDLVGDLELLADKDYGGLELTEIRREFKRLAEFLNNKAMGLRRQRMIAQIRAAEEAGDESRGTELSELLDHMSFC
ncbi:MAG: DNA primase [Candidatus Jacksonbacteria bacterium]